MRTVFRNFLHARYGLSPRDFVAVAIAKGTDFAEPTLRLGCWDTALRMCGDFVRTRPLFCREGRMCFKTFLRMSSSAALAAKSRARPRQLSVSHKDNVEFNLHYWVSNEVFLNARDELEGAKDAGARTDDEVEGACWDLTTPPTPRDTSLPVEGPTGGAGVAVGLEGM